MFLSTARSIGVEMKSINDLKGKMISFVLGCSRFALIFRPSGQRTYDRVSRIRYLVKGSFGVTCKYVYGGVRVFIEMVSFNDDLYLRRR